MCHFTVGCTTDAHQLYQTFLICLSQCIFEYSREDLDALIAAKRPEIEAVSIRTPSDSDVLHHISKKELALHCWRQTRGVETTTKLIHEFLLAFDGEQGHDSLGVPLLNSQMLVIWETLKPHTACIQDPEGEQQMQLYTETGTVLKGASSFWSSDVHGGQPPWNHSTCTSISSSQVNPILASLLLFLVQILFWQLRYNFVADSIIRSQNKWTLFMFYDLFGGRTIQNGKMHVYLTVLLAVFLCAPKEEYSCEHALVISGTSANHQHFQVFLLEGICRWNQ